MDLKFSDRLPRVARDVVSELRAITQWFDASRGLGDRVASLVGGPVHAREVRLAGHDGRDRFAAACDIRVHGTTLRVSAPGATVRMIAQRLLGGPFELDAPRPTTIAERAVWTLVVAAALVDIGVAGQAWLALDGSERADGIVVALELDVDGQPVTVWLDVPRELARRVRLRMVGAWSERVAVDVMVAIARCALAADVTAALAIGDVVTVERVAGGAELVIGDGSVAVAASPGAVVATVASEYVRRDMTIGDDAQLELVVTLGTTRLSLRQLAELAVGQVVPLGRPLAGPFELRAAGRLLGRGELVDVDGELGVRVVSLGDSP